MKKLQLWQGLPVLLLSSGCFYSYTTIVLGPDGGAASSGSVSSSSNGSTGGNSSGSGSNGGGSSGSGSTGLGSTGGGAASSGGTTGAAGSSGGVELCAPPAGNTWPLNCSAQYSVVTGPAIGDISIVPVDGGYLIGFVGDVQDGYYGGEFEMLTLFPDGGWNVGAAGASTTAAGSLSLVPPAGSSPAALIAGSYDANGAAADYDQILCASPFAGDAGVPFEFVYDTDGDYAEVDKIRFARNAGGTLGFVVADYFDDVAGYGIGPSGGGCPSSATAIPALNAGVIGTSTPSDSAIVPMGTDLFALAQTYVSDQGNDVLAILTVPTGGDIANVRFGAGEDPWSAIATDGTNVSVVVSDDDTGVLLYALDGGSLQKVATLGTTNGYWLTAASCGTDCTLVGWVEGAQGSNGNNSYTPNYAVVNGEGCGVVQSFPAVMGQAPAPVAVAAVPEGAIFAYVLNSLNPSTDMTTTQLFVTLCTP
jgi:hypothetical protein